MFLHFFGHYYILWYLCKFLILYTHTVTLCLVYWCSQTFTFLFLLAGNSHFCRQKQMCVWVQDLNPGFHLYLLLLPVTPSAVATYVKYKQREMTQEGKHAASKNSLKVFLMHSAFLSFVHVHVLCTSGLWLSIYV